MVVTVGAINKKDVNNLYKESEKTGGEKSIDLIKATRPIIIVDEPQSVDGGLEGRGKEALDAMNRSEEHTSELQSLMRISYAVFCLKKKKRHTSPTRKKYYQQE